jgi:phenylacetate-CoA ligase
MLTVTDVPAASTTTPRRWRPGATVLAIVEIVLRVLARRFGTMRWTLERTSPSVSSALSEARALRTARDAARRVPAYRDHLERQGIDPAHIRSLDELPETDKASYIDPNPLPSRCLDGRLPLIGSTIDESSGSTGTPYNWVRGAAERDHVRRMISFFARYSFGDEALIVLNAFSMGAWATGLTTAIALERNGLVKATGPHVDKILGTMRELGTDHRYLIVGYPPFLKLLLDEGDAQGFDWSAYTMHALLGGEGHSEGLRDYLLRRFRSVVSGYGATDVEIGLAAETPVTVALRRLALERREIAEALFGEADRVPMVFQYNPMLHHVETNAGAEGPLQRPRRGRGAARRRAAPPPGGHRDHAGVAGAGRLRPPRPHAVPVRLRPRRLDRLGHGREHLSRRRRGRHLCGSVARRTRPLVPALAARGEAG